MEKLFLEKSLMGSYDYYSGRGELIGSAFFPLAPTEPETDSQWEATDGA